MELPSLNNRPKFQPSIATEVRLAIIMREAPGAMSADVVALRDKPGVIQVSRNVHRILFIPGGEFNPLSLRLLVGGGSEPSKEGIASPVRIGITLTCAQGAKKVLTNHRASVAPPTAPITKTT